MTQTTQTPAKLPDPKVGAIAMALKSIASALGDPRQKIAPRDAGTLRRAANLLIEQRAEIRRLKRRLAKLEAPEASSGPASER